MIGSEHPITFFDGSQTNPQPLGPERQNKSTILQVPYCFLTILRTFYLLDEWTRTLLS